MTIKEMVQEEGAPVRKDKLSATELDGPLRAKLFAVAVAGWNEAFKPEGLRELLSKSDLNRNAIREVRKAGLMLRSAHYLFTEPRKLPYLDDLVKAIGTHNDSMNIDNVPNHLPVLEAITSYPATETDTVPVGDREYQERLYANAQQITDIASRKFVGEETFHNMRRYLKHFLSIYRMIEALQEGEPHPMRLRLDALNDHLGKMRDDNLEIIDGKVEPKEPLMHIDGKLRREIMKVVRKVMKK